MQCDIFSSALSHKYLRVSCCLYFFRIDQISLTSCKHLTDAPLLIRSQHENMPDQVKYANKLNGKNVLVIGGSSGTFPGHPLIPLKQQSNTYPPRHWLLRRRSLSRIRCNRHHFLVQPRPRRHRRLQTAVRLPISQIPSLRPRLQPSR